MAQKTPFQRSASVCSTPFLTMLPTATQSNLTGHETASRSVTLGLGRICVFQLPPDQNSANGCAVVSVPTAMQNWGDQQDTEPSVPFTLTTGTGETSCHRKVKSIAKAWLPLSGS